MKVNSKPLTTRFKSLNIDHCFIVGVINIFTTSILFGCGEEETYDYYISPYIEYSSLRYIEMDNTADSLVLVFDIADQEGDFGFEDRGPVRPYPNHQFDMIVDSELKFVTFSGNDHVPPFYTLHKDIDGEFETEYYSDQDLRPAEYSCIHYDGRSLDRSVLTNYYEIDESIVDKDNFYIRRNDNRFNLFIDFYAERNGIWEAVDWRYLFDTNGCGINFNLSVESPNNSFLGEVAYRFTRLTKFKNRFELKMISNGFRVVANGGRVKLRVKIKDRELNESNQIETEAIFLN